MRDYDSFLSNRPRNPNPWLRMAQDAGEGNRKTDRASRQHQQKSGNIGTAGPTTTANSNDVGNTDNVINTKPHFV